MATVIGLWFEMRELPELYRNYWEGECHGKVTTRLQLQGQRLHVPWAARP